MNLRRGFTLMELLIVMAIICILAGLLAPKMIDSMKNARETGCRNNMRQLQAGVLSYSLDNSGYLPRALSYEVKDSSTGIYYERRAWVAWMPKNKNIDTLDKTWQGSSNNKKSHSSEMNDDRGLGSAGRFGVLYGTIWDYVGDAQCYVCPVQQRELGSDTSDFADDKPTETKDENKLYRTYAMNPAFGSPHNSWRYWDPVDSSDIGVSWKVAGRVVAASKTVLFYEFDASKVTSSDPQSRSKYSTYADGMDDQDKYIGLAAMDPKDYDDKTLALGAVHSGASKSSPRTAMVVYYDGHIEKVPTFYDPQSSKGNTLWFLNRGLTPSDKDPTSTSTK